MMATRPCKPVLTGHDATTAAGLLMDALADTLREVADRLAAVEAAVQRLVEQRTVKEWYSTADVALLLGKAEFTVREWCRLGRVRAAKKKAGRGPAGEWVVSHDELARVRNEGLLPILR